MRFTFTWPNVEGRLRDYGERNHLSQSTEVDDFLIDLGFLDGDQLSEAGERYFLVRWVAPDEEQVAEVLRDALIGLPKIQAFGNALWGRGQIPVAGAVSLLKRLGLAADDTESRRWLELLSRAHMVSSYNRKQPNFRVDYNPHVLTPDDEPAPTAHIVSPETPYGNLLALRELVRAGRDSIRWYEQHMPAKVLEVLYKEADGANISKIRLLSGPANIDADAKSDFKRFRKEMKSVRGIDAEWRVLEKPEAFRHHDRFFISDEGSWNVPPVNTILAGSTGEFLPSDLKEAEFDVWWSQGTDITSFIPSSS